MVWAWAPSFVRERNNLLKVIAAPEAGAHAHALSRVARTRHRSIAPRCRVVPLLLRAHKVVFERRCSKTRLSKLPSGRTAMLLGLPLPRRSRADRRRYRAGAPR